LCHSGMRQVSHRTATIDAPARRRSERGQSWRREASNT
jgi:hypothetical protein